MKASADNKTLSLPLGWRLAEVVKRSRNVFWYCFEGKKDGKDYRIILETTYEVPGFSVPSGQHLLRRLEHRFNELGDKG